MAKLKTTPITQSDLAEHLATSGDFAFEMQILRTIRSLGLACEHGGHYEDPITKKSREFDIRAMHSLGITKSRFAIECKNIRENFPVLISCVRRNESEAFHEFVAIEAPSPQVIPIGLPLRLIVHRASHSPLYDVGGWVGKSIEQVGRDTQGGLTANDSDIYDKWGQALASLQDLIDQAGDDEPPARSFGLRAVLPMVVVPNTRLWAVCYGEDGAIVETPHRVDRVSCYVNKVYRVGVPLIGAHLTLSHLEIVTEQGLRDLLTGLEKFALYPNTAMDAVRQRLNA